MSSERSSILRSRNIQRTLPSRKVDNRAERLVAEDSFSSTLLLVALDLLGPEMYGWTDEAIQLEVADRLNVIVPVTNLNRIMAAIDIVTSDDFSYRLPRFIRLCNILAGDETDLDTFDFADPDEMSWAVLEAGLLNPDLLENFHPEIQAYTAAECLAHGLSRLPKTLAYAQPYWQRTFSPDDFADDPQMFAAVANKLDDEVNQIDQNTAENMQRLFTQIEELHLKEGNTTDVRRRLNG